MSSLTSISNVSFACLPEYVTLWDGETVYGKINYEKDGQNFSQDLIGPRGWNIIFFHEHDVEGGKNVVKLGYALIVIGVVGGLLGSLSSSPDWDAFPRALTGSLGLFACCTGFWAIGLGKKIISKGIEDRNKAILLLFHSNINN